MNNRNDPYNTSYQQRDVGGSEYAHLRKESAMSMSDVLAEPTQQPSNNYPFERQGSYPPPSQRKPSLPANAYTQGTSYALTVSKYSSPLPVKMKLQRPELANHITVTRQWSPEET